MVCRLFFYKFSYTLGAVTYPSTRRIAGSLSATVVGLYLVVNQDLSHGEEHHDEAHGKHDEEDTKSEDGDSNDESEAENDESKDEEEDKKDKSRIESKEEINKKDEEERISAPDKRDEVGFLRCYLASLC
jgi:hypothetical protein